MNELIERFKIAAQEAQRINALPAKGASAYPVRIRLEIDARGVKIAGTRGPSRTHDYVVSWPEIEQARVNPIVAQIGHTVEHLTV